MLVFAVTFMSIAFWSATALLIYLRTRDTLHVGIIVIAFFLISYPLKLLATYGGFATMNSSIMPADAQLLALGLANLSLLAAMLPLLVLAGRPAVQEPRISVPAIVWAGVSVLAVVVTIDIQSLLLRLTPGSYDDYLQGLSQSRLSGGLKAILNIIVQAALAGLTLTLIVRWRALSRVFRIGAVALVAFYAAAVLFSTGSKYAALFPIATAVLLWNVARVGQGKGFSLWRTMGIGVTGLVLVGIFGLLRGLGNIEEAAETGHLYQIAVQFFNAFDAMDNLVFIIMRIDNFWFGDLNFRPTLDYLVTGFIPRQIWPDKPLEMGNIYIMKQYLWERYNGPFGEVVSPSMPGEMLLSGGIFFLVSWSAICGGVFGALYRWAHGPNADIWAVIIYAYAALNIFNYMRSGTGALGVIFLFAAVTLLMKIGLIGAGKVAQRLAVKYMLAPAHNPDTRRADRSR
ncbi:hypothetical protein [Caenispirillum salinarum]|uniref:hypothetical protein n=1 Tax=Caenispirillum salinarum TaxID=859058 RepID=UPI00384FC3FD